MTLTTNEGHAPLRVLLASARDDESEATARLRDLGHVVDTCDTESLAMRPDADVVLVSTGSASALEAIRRVSAAGCAPVVALVEAVHQDSAVELMDAGVSGVIRRSDPGLWGCILAIAANRHRELRSLQGALDRRATTERAVGILMERHGLEPDVAFSLLRGRARDRNRRLGDLAASIVDGHGLLPNRPDGGR